MKCHWFVLYMIIDVFCCLADTSIATRFVKTDFHLHTLDRMLGDAQPGKSFRFVRACARAAWLLSGIESEIVLVVVFQFLFWSQRAFPFPCGLEELSLFPSPHPPKPPIQLQFGLSVKNICEVSASTHAHATGRHYTTIQRSGIDTCET